jgi:hypothetical protein
MTSLDGVEDYFVICLATVTYYSNLQTTLRSVKRPNQPWCPLHPYPYVVRT